MKRILNQSGFGIIEVMISLALVVILVVAISNVLSNVYKLYNASQNKVQALALAQESLETISATKPVTAAQVAALTGSANQVVGTTKYSREIVITNACRNGSGDITSFASSGTCPNAETRKVTVTVSWTEKGVTKTISLSKIFTAWQS